MTASEDEYEELLLEEFWCESCMDMCGDLCNYDPSTGLCDEDVL